MGLLGNGEVEKRPLEVVGNEIKADPSASQGIL